MKPQDDGRAAELQVMSLLTYRGFRVERMKECSSPFDLLLDGNIRIEVKTCDGVRGGEGGENSQIKWLFNIHRHNILDESGVDFYILKLNYTPIFKYPVHLLIEASIGRPTI